MNRLVTIMITTNDIVEFSVHLPHQNGNLATLCGLDGDDPHMAVGQKIVETLPGAKVTCVQCRAIWELCKEFNL